MILFLKHWREALVIAAVLALVGMCRARDAALVEKGRAEQDAAQLTQKTAELTHRADSLSRALRVDTVRLTKWRDRYRVARDTVLQRSTDTLTVREFVTVADSTIQACSITVQTCSKALAAKDSLLALTHKNYEGRERLIRSQHRSEVIRWSIISLLLGAAGAFVLGS